LRDDEAAGNGASRAVAAVLVFQRASHQLCLIAGLSGDATA